MLEYFNCYTSKNELYKYESMKQELKENGFSDKKEKVNENEKDKKDLRNS